MLPTPQIGVGSIGCVTLKSMVDLLPSRRHAMETEISAETLEPVRASLFDRQL